MHAHHVAQHPADVASRHRVVAHERDPGRCHALPNNLQQLMSRRVRDPRVHSVRDDVIELAVSGVRGRERALHQLDVFDAKFAERGLASRDRRGREIDADEVGAREGHRHGDEVAAVATAKFQQCGMLRAMPWACRAGGQGRLIDRFDDALRAPEM